MTDTQDASPGETDALLDGAGEQASKILERILAAAQPGAVFGQPVQSGSYTLITAAEVSSGGGFGAGMGRGPTPDAGQSPPAGAAPTPAERPIGGGGYGGGGGP